MTAAVQQRYARARAYAKSTRAAPGGNIGMSTFIAPERPPSARIAARATPAESLADPFVEDTRDVPRVEAFEDAAPARTAVAVGDARQGVDDDVVAEDSVDPDDDLPLRIGGAAPRKNYPTALVQTLAGELRSRRTPSAAEEVTDEEIDLYLPETMEHVRGMVDWSSFHHLLLEGKLADVRRRVRAVLKPSKGKDKGKGGGQETDASRARKDRKGRADLNAQLKAQKKVEEAARVARDEQLLADYMDAHEVELGLGAELPEQELTRGRRLRSYLDGSVTPINAAMYAVARQYYTAVTYLLKKVRELEVEVEGSGPFAVFLAAQQNRICVVVGPRQDWSLNYLQTRLAPDPSASPVEAFGVGISFANVTPSDEPKGKERGWKNLQRGRTAKGFSLGKDPNDPTGKTSLPPGPLSEDLDAVRRRLKRAREAKAKSEAHTADLVKQLATAEAAAISHARAAAAEENLPPPVTSVSRAAPHTSAPIRRPGRAATIAKTAPLQQRDVNVNPNNPRFRPPFRR